MGLWRVLSDLEEDGYRTEWGLFSAEETGAPHQRIRCFILAHRTDLGLSGAFGIENQESKRGDDARRESTIEGVGESELAHTASREPRQSQARNGGQDIGGGSEDTQWPARPGEEQYEWEEPRVTEVIGKLGGGVDGASRGVDAIANRVDRLRLLGNGVVSQCAELAWRTLWKKMN